MTLVVGLTGGIGAGKSTVGGMLAQRGAAVIDVDVVGRDILERDGEAYEAVVGAFGQGVLAADGSIDRSALGAIVFGPENRLAELEAISHPAINDRLGKLVDQAGADLVVLDMAVLVESELGYEDQGPMYQRVIVVEACIDVRIHRLLDRGLSEDQARARMATQASDTDRRLVADMVVLNNGDLAELAHAVNVIWPSIEAWHTQVHG